MKNNISEYGSHEKYIDPAVKGDYLNKLQQTIDWIYGEGQSASNDEYKKRLTEFKVIGNPVKVRARFHDEFPVYNSQFNGFVQEVNDRIVQATNLHDKYREDIILKTGEMTQYFNSILQSLASKQLHQDPSFNIDEVLHKLEAYK